MAMGEYALGGSMNNSMRGRLLDDVTALIEEVEDLLESGVDATSESLREAQQAARGRLRSAKERLGKFEHDVTHEVKERAVRTDKYVRDNPWGSIGATAAVAFLLGYWMSRRD
jgi:ElaB protein